MAGVAMRRDDQEIDLPPDEIVRQSFDLAVKAHNDGDLENAEALYRAIVCFRPTHADALHGLGVLAHQVGQSGLAVDWFGHALAQRNDPTFHNNLALALLALNRPHEAMAEALKALELRSAYPQAYNALGNIQDKLGLKEEAVASYRQALDLAPDYVDAMSNLGKVLKDRKALDEARELFTRAIAQDPSCVEALNNLGALCREDNDPDEALTHLSKAIALRPHYFEAYVNRGQAHVAKEEFQRAEADFRCALALKPDFAEAWCGLGAVCFRTRRIEESIEHYERALDLDEACSAALTGAGAAHLKLEQFDKARNYLDRAIAHEDVTTQAEAHFVLGNDLHLKGHLDEGIECFNRALSHNPDHCDARNNRSLAFQYKGDLNRAIAGYDDVLRRNERHLAAFSNRLMVMHYMESITNADMLAVSRRFGAAYDKPLSEAEARRSRDLDAERTLRIGYVSGDFNGHPVAMFLLKAFVACNRQAFHITCYSNDSEADWFTKQFKDRADSWREIAGVSDADVATMIADDEIDILVDLAGHTNKNRIALFGLKPAPIQVEWLGYFGTSGLKSIDYILLDAVSAPDGHDQFFVEKIVRLPHGRFCYTPAPFDLPCGDPPCVKNGFVTFGSFNNISKIGDSVIALWSRLMREVPDSRLLLKWKTLKTESVRDTLRAAFARHGIAGERVEFRSESVHNESLRQYQDMDIALDTFPFGGATTSCEALWMGVPVLTLPGERLPSRQTLGFLSELDATELAASSPDDFVARGAALARDADRLIAYRRRLRPALEQAPFCDGAKIMANVEAAFRQMWRRHCRGESPEAFAIPRDG